MIGKYNNQEKLYCYEGWNEDEDYNEVDIIKSDYYVSEEEAKSDYISAKNKYFRQNWCCNSYTIGECGWREGFERVIEPQYISKNECYTYFKIIGDFDPNEITEWLGLQPEKTRKIGDLRSDGSKYDCAVWIFGRCDEYTPHVEKQMRKTISPLLEKVDILKKIYGQYDVSYVLEIVPTIYPNEVTPVLAPPLDIIDFCHATRTEVDIDLYVVDGESEFVGEE